LMAERRQTVLSPKIVSQTDQITNSSLLVLVAITRNRYDNAGPSVSRKK